MTLTVTTVTLNLPVYAMTDTLAPGTNVLFATPAVLLAQDQATTSVLLVK